MRRTPSVLASRAQLLSLGRKPHILAVPLGTYLLEDVPFVPFEKRPYDVSYAGSTVNRSQEAHRRIPTKKARSRQELAVALHQLIVTHPRVRVGLHVIESFHDASADTLPYSELVMGSRITLCPRGGSLETYRFFEALRCGSVPVTERLPDAPYYTRAPAVQVRSWSKLPAVVDRLLVDPDALRSRHDAVRSWWAERCSPLAVAQQLLAALHMSRDQANG